MIRTVSFWRALCVAAVLATGCGDSDADGDDGDTGDGAVGEPDSGVDSGHEDPDAGTDSGTDAGPDCTDACTADALRCADNNVEKCVEGEDGCLAFEVEDECNDTNEYCDDSASPVACVAGCEGDLDCDDVPTADDCDDTDASLGASAADADCDGVLTAADCDDDDADLGAIAADADCDGLLTAADCDDNDNTSTSVAADADCDGLLTADDCDDTDNSSTAIAADADCDGVLTAADCDDTNASLGAVAADADCDGALTAADCDDGDPLLGAIANDADCDGAVTAADCDDNDNTSTVIATDADCDTVLTADDCDDTDASLGAVAADADCDGALTADDCDDSNASVGAVANDADCDGAVTAEDCDDDDVTLGSMANDADCDRVLTADDCDDTDNTSTVVADDADCDTVLTADDCDDTDASLGAMAADVDCDGALTADDCDDNNPSVGASANDADCDGTVTAEDCDDTDNTSTVIADDADCDTILTADDCDDTDATSTAVADDADCDTVLTADDCDDTNASLGAMANDVDCDGALTAEDCDDADANLGSMAMDADCDGALTAEDCDDTDENSNVVADDGDCDGVLTADDCDDSDETSTVVADDADCDGVLTADDCDDSDPDVGASATDTDCDGAVAGLDCDDTDENVGADPNDVDCDGNADIVLFEKTNYANPEDAENQDCVTENVCITRGDSGGLFNAVAESSYDDDTPTDVEYAVGHVGDGTTPSVWRDAIRNPTWWVMMPTAMHLITDDLWFNTVTYRWTAASNGGGFAHARAQAKFFEKANFADATQPENQDCLTPGVCLTRGDTQGLYNAAVESSFGGPNTSPAGTRWAPMATAQATPGDYTSFTTATGSNPQSMLGQVMSVHVDGTNVYYDVVLTAWSGGNTGGGFAYWRSRALVVGCTDSEAANFDPSATVDDGYCGDWQRITIPSDADPLLPENQDCLGTHVCLTRGTTEGPFNGAAELSYGDWAGPSPAHTLWAYGETANVDASDYTDWREAVDGCPVCELGAPLSMWIPAEGLLFDIVVVRFPGNDSGGGMTYLRRSVPLSGTCGDTVTDVGEACDDGDDDDTNGCTNACLPSGCGNLVVEGDEEGGEECDDGSANGTAGSLCSLYCEIVVCGDGEVDDGEDCDDGNTDPTDGCDADCRVEEGWECPSFEGSSLCFQPCGQGTGAEFGQVRQSDGACLLAYASSRAYVSARTTCRVLGGDLVSIEDATANSQVALATQFDGPVWIGLSDDTTEGTFQWSDGTELNYTNWAEDEPDNGDGEGPENCVQVSSNGEWSDRSCTDSRPYVCATLCGNGTLDAGEECDNGPENSNAPESTCRTNCTVEGECGDAIVDEGEDCDDGNNEDGDSCAGNCTFVCGSGVGAKATTPSPSDGCYLAFDQSENFNTAEAACVGLGGHLASIGSAEVNDTLSELVLSADLNTVWIGFTDAAVEGTFEWTDAAAVVYTNWNGGEPNNVSNEDCTELQAQSGGWNDGQCATELGYVCEVP